MKQEKNTEYSTIKDRVLKIIEIKLLKKREFYLQVGVSNGYLDKVAGIGSDILERILTQYPDISTEWLVLGKGNMLVKDNQTSENVSLNVHPSVHPKDKNMVNEPETAYLIHPKAQIVTVTLNAAGGAAVPMFDIKAAAGLPANHDNPEYYKDLPSVTVPWIREDGDYAYIQVTGDSMQPTIYHADWLLAKRIANFNDIREGYIHIVVANDGVVVKRVLNRVEKRKALALQSDNDFYTTYDLPIKEILAIWKVEWKLSANLRNENASIRKDVNGLMRDMLDVKDKLLRIES